MLLVSSPYHLLLKVEISSMSQGVLVYHHACKHVLWFVCMCVRVCGGGGGGVTVHVHADGLMTAAHNQ